MEAEKNSCGHSGAITCEIPFKLPSLNDYIKENRINRYKGAQMKQRVQKDIALFIRKLPRFEKPVTIQFHWIEQHKRRDLDNIAFAKKFILDAMVDCGKLKDDNRRCVVGFTDVFSYGPETKVVLTIREAET